MSFPSNLSLEGFCDFGARLFHMENNPRIKSFLGYIISWTAPKWFDPDKSQETCQCAIDSAAFVCVCQTLASPHTSIWVFPKIGVGPKMDGEINGKPNFLMDDLGGKTHYFRKHPYISILWQPSILVRCWMPDIHHLETFHLPIRIRRTWPRWWSIYSNMWFAKNGWW